jgi:hypothetical protein
LKKTALIALLASALVGFNSCSGPSAYRPPPNSIFNRVMASQDVTSLNSEAGVVIINGEFDELELIRPISTGGTPQLLVISPNRSTLLAYDSSNNQVGVINTAKTTLTTSVQLPGPTNSMAFPSTLSYAYAAVPTAPLIGLPPGAVEIMNLTSGAIVYNVSVPNVQTVAASPNGTQLLAFSSGPPSISNSVTVITPSLGPGVISATTVSVPGFDQPVNAVFSGDGSTAYVLNCGPECGGTQASVQMLDLTTSPPTPGAVLPVDGATFAMISGTTLLVVGSPPNAPCTGEMTAAKTCGRLDLVDLNSFTLSGSVVITDGYHTVMSESANGQLFIGAMDCTNIGNVNAPQGEVRGCLSIYNTTNGQVVIPPDNGDVTDLQSFTTRFVEYVAEGGNLRVYDTQQDKLLVENNNGIIVNGTIGIVGQVYGVKAIDFF